MVRQFLSIASIKTASRCWVPVTKTSRAATIRSFSSRQRCVNFNTVEHDKVNLISNDDVLSAEDIGSHNDAPFEPVVYSSEEIFTAGPVNKV